MTQVFCCPIFSSFDMMLDFNIRSYIILLGLLYIIEKYMPLKNIYSYVRKMLINDNFFSDTYSLRNFYYFCYNNLCQVSLLVTLEMFFNFLSSLYPITSRDIQILHNSLIFNCFKYDISKNIKKITRLKP